MPERKFNAGKAFRMTALLILLGALAYGFVELNRTLPLPPLPVPNGNDDFAKAGQALLGDPLNFSQTNVVTLRSQVASNALSLRLIRQGASKKCRISVPYSNTYINQRMTELKSGKQLALLLQADGRLAELEQRTNDAARIHLETIRYGQEFCRGGVIIDRLVGIACETIGTISLQRITSGLDAKTCRLAAKQLQEADYSREPLKDVLYNEQAWMRASANLRERIQVMIPIESLNPSRRVRKGFVQKCNQAELQLRRLMVDLATRAYELEHCQPPKSLNELVPEYLDAVPLDPATGTKLTH